MISCDVIIEKRKEIWQKSRDIEQDKRFREAVARKIIEDENIRKEIQEYPEKLIEMCFVIVNKEKQTVPFFLNEVQKDFIERINRAKREYREGKRLHIRFLVLKGRQQGFTSVITAYQLACTITRKNFEGFTAADEDMNTTAIFENKAKFPYMHLPEILKPSEKYNNRKQFLFEKLNSSWEVKTASPNMGRSRTINFFHGSEVAFWKDGISGVQAGLGEALTKDAIQIYESTANGYNEYKELWDSGAWENCFYEWWRTPEYRLKFESPTKETWFKQQVETGKNSEWIWKRCYWLRHSINLDWEQVYWYYVKYEGYIDKELIKQEYPCSPDEAFISTGQCIFDQEKLIARIQELECIQKKNKPRRGIFVYNMHNDKIIDSTIRFIDDPNGPVTIYEEPQNRTPYVLGADTAEGGNDKCAGQILNNITGNQAAVWHGRTDTDLFAKQLYCIGRYYNGALIAVETNFDLHPVKELQRLGYPLQYKREVIDSVTNRKQEKFGFQTTRVTRPVIIAELVAFVREHIELINDIPTLREMLTFVRNEQGKPEAIEGKNDDLVMSLAIANKAREQQTMTFDHPTAWNAIPESGEAKREYFDIEDEYTEETAESLFW